MKMEIELLTKKKKHLIRSLKRYMQERYSRILEYLLSKSEDAGDDVGLFIKNEPNFFETVKTIKRNLIYQNHLKQYKRAIMPDIDEAEIFLNTAREQIVIIKNEIKYVESKKYFSAKQIKGQQTQLANLREKVERLKETELNLQHLIAARQPEKRGPGRPPSKTKNLTKEKIEYANSNSEESAREETKENNLEEKKIADNAVRE